MKLYVCIKHVPDSAAAITVIDRNRFDESIKFIMNPYDEIALEEALRVKERMTGAEIVAVTLGSEDSINTLRQALAMGADRGICIRTRERPDSITTARALGAVITQDGKPDIVFGGRASIDSEGMQTLFRLAAALDMPVVTDVVAFSLDAGRVTVEREIEAGAREVMELVLPCVIGAGKGLNTPRFIKLMEIMKAKKKEIKQLDLDGLNFEKPASRVEVVELKPSVEERRRTILKGDPKETVEQLVGLLKEEAKVL